jgi:SAM-dependent methyltransferase
VNIYCILEGRWIDDMESNEFNLYLKTAKYYDYDNRDNLTADIPFYLEYAKKVAEGILELGCGTGRVAIPLAKAGFNVTGLDLSDSMIEIFNEKLKNVPEQIRNRVRLLKGSMSSFSFDQKYDLIIAPFRAFQALTEKKDISNCLKCVHEHLSENGLFIINVFRPNKVLDESWCYPETVQWETVDQNTGTKITKKHWGSKIDVERQVIYPNFAYEILDKSGNLKRIEEKLSLKYYYYQQLKDYLKASGLNVEEEYGWYDKTNINCNREMIFVCRRVVY